MLTILTVLCSPFPPSGRNCPGRTPYKLQMCFPVIQQGIAQPRGNKGTTSRKSLPANGFWCSPMRLLVSVVPPERQLAAGRGADHRLPAGQPDRVEQAVAGTRHAGIDDQLGLDRERRRDAAMEGRGKTTILRNGWSSV